MPEEPREISFSSLLQFLFIHSFLIALGFPVLPPFTFLLIFLLFPFSSRPAWFLYDFHLVGKKRIEKYVYNLIKVDT